MVVLKETAAMLAVVAVAASAFSGESLIRDGAFDGSQDKKVSAEYHCTAGKLVAFTEEWSWNRCGKLIVPAGKANKKGDISYHALMYAGGDAEHEGFAAEPNAIYDFSFEVKGDIRSARVRAFEWVEKDGGLARRKLPLDLQVQPGKDWKRVSGRFHVDEFAKRAAIGVELWSSPTSDTGLKEGDFLLLDNFRVEKSAANDKLFASGRKVAVAPISPVAEMAVPFFPEELIDAPSEIRLRAAVNEQKPLPLAIANLTDKTAHYRVILETVPEGTSASGIWPINGAFGLKDFPPERITVRQAFPFKETEEEPVTLRLDPLPRINEAGIVSLAAKEAGLVWFDFDTHGVNPGEYRGRIRVIPLGAGAKYEFNGKRRRYDVASDELFVPVTLTVDPIVLSREAARPGHLCAGAETQEEFDLLADVGAEFFKMNIWWFGPGSVTNADNRVARSVREHRAWAAARGIKPRFFVKYSTFNWSQRVYNPKKLPERKWEVWRKALEYIHATMANAGVPEEDYFVETWDEPCAADLPDMVEAHRIAKGMYPTMRLYMPLCVRDILKTDFLGALNDTTDLWIFLDNPAYFSGGLYERIRKVHAAGKPVMHYLCSVGTSLSLSSYYRRHCWRGECYGLDGDFLFQFVDSCRDGTLGGLSFKAKNYGNIVYRSFDTFIPSIHYMAYREGVTDVKYLAKLREVAGNDPEVKSFLADAARQVIIERPEARDLPAEMRDRARDLILKKQGK